MKTLSTILFAIGLAFSTAAPAQLSAHWEPNPERLNVQQLRDIGYTVVYFSEEDRYGLPQWDFDALLTEAGWNIIVDYAPDFPHGDVPPQNEQPPIGGEIPEEPPLIEGEFYFDDGTDLFCIFPGTVSITEDGLLVEGCGTQDIVCDELIFAEINTFAPEVVAEECVYVNPREEKR